MLTFSRTLPLASISLSLYGSSSTSYFHWLQGKYSSRSRSSSQAYRGTWRSHKHDKFSTVPTNHMTLSKYFVTASHALFLSSFISKYFLISLDFFPLATSYLEVCCLISKYLGILEISLYYWVLVNSINILIKFHSYELYWGLFYDPKYNHSWSMSHIHVKNLYSAVLWCSVLEMSIGSKWFIMLFKSFISLLTCLSTYSTNY